MLELLRKNNETGLRCRTKATVFNDIILDHFEHPRNAGELAPPAHMIETSNPVCGDILRVSLLANEGCIDDIRFKARGCVAAIACGSMLTEIAMGKTLEQAALLSAKEISAALGGLPPESGHAAELAEQALKIALRVAGSQRG